MNQYVAIRPWLMGMGSLLGVVLFALPARAAFTFTTVDYPSALTSGLDTISDNVIAGGSNLGTFLYNGSTFTTFNNPLGDGGISGISGNTFVGTYSGPQQSGVVFAPPNHGYIYNGVSFVTLDDPSVVLPYEGGGTFANGVSGGTVVGDYSASATLEVNGFIYNGSSFQDLIDPLAGTGGFDQGTYPMGISGSTIVGYYEDASSATHGFVDNGGVFSTLDDPLGVDGTFPTAISGNIVVGYYADSAGQDHGFVYNGSTFATVDDPIGDGTLIYGVDGSTIVGDFFNSHGVSNGFTATSLPEPGMPYLLALMSFGLCKRRCRSAP